MTGLNRTSDNRYIEAIELLSEIVWAYNVKTKSVRNGRRNGGAIGDTGCRVFRYLAQKKGAFVRPVPYVRKAFIDEVVLSGGAIDGALKRLGEQGLVTLSGTGQAATVQLHVPPHVFDLYQQLAGKIAIDAESDPPVDRHELDAILGMLDDPGFERFIARQNAREGRS